MTKLSYTGERINPFGLSKDEGARVCEIVFKRLYELIDEQNGIDSHYEVKAVKVLDYNGEGKLANKGACKYGAKIEEKDIPF